MKSRSDPLRAGWSRWQALFGLALLPPLLAAPLRVVLSLPLKWANLIGLLAAVGCGWLMRSWLPPPSQRTGSRWMVRLLPLFVAAAATWALYTRAFGGLTEIVGADGGNHAANLNAFRDHPNSYLGFVSMYAAWDAVVTVFRLNPFWSFVVVFYLVVTCVAAMSLVPALVVLFRFDHEHPRAWWAGASATALASLAALGLVVLPLVHYFQSEGFWPQLFGLVPLVLLWCLDATLRVGWQRLLAWLIGVALVRYTYGLNLAEILLALGTVLILESRGRLRYLAVLGAAGCGAAAWVFLRQVWPLFDAFGWFIPYPLTKVLWAEGLAVAAILVTTWGNRPATKGMGLVRALRLPLLFGGLGAAVAAFVQAMGPQQLYYLLKLPFQNVVALALGLVVCLGAVVSTLWVRRTPRNVIWGAVVMALALSAGQLWLSAFEPYRAGYLERIAGKPPFKVLRPLADLGAWKRIESTLREQKAEFGGYLVTFGPMSNFMNSALGVAEGQRFYFEGLPPKAGKGHCVFWDESKNALWSDWDERFPHRNWVKSFSMKHNHLCVEYFSHWDKSERRRLCYSCD